MDYNSSDFKALQKKWYDKLAAKGFEDIEQPDGKLKAWTSRSSKNDRIPGLREAKEEYYRMAGHFAHDYKFSCAKDRIAWQKHSEGISIKNIVSLLAKKGIRTNKRAVHETLQRLRAVMMKGNYHGQD